MTRDTCWGNDTRYGCGLTMASFSQEGGAARDLNNRKQSFPLFISLLKTSGDIYDNYFPLYEYENTERVQSESKFTLDTARRTETNSMRA